MKKRITIRNVAKRDFTFEVERIRDRYDLVGLDFTTFFTTRNRIGNTGNLEDAISLAKTCVDGEVCSVKIKDV